MSSILAQETGEHGLKKDAIGFSDGLTIALASTAPAYSLAAVIGSIVVIVGFQAPAALGGIACAVYYRRELRKSVKNFLFVGVAPVIESLLLGYLFFKALVDYADPANSYTGASWFGVAPPAVIGVGFLVLGVILLLAWRRHRLEPFFLRRREVAPPGLLEEPPPIPPAAPPAFAEGE
jgi:hypothetical protein